MIHSSPFERMTALTDVFLGILAAILAAWFGQLAGFKPAVWSWAFGLLAFSSFLGAAAHGLEMSRKTNDRLWQPLNLGLGLALGLFVVGALFDLSGEDAARSALPFMLAAGFIFFLVTVFVPGSFLTFIAYEAVAMLFSSVVYGYLAVNGKLPGAGWMLAGVLVTILAAVVQVIGKAGKPMIWYFDNNGVFHWIQMAGLILIAVGLNAAL